LVRAHNGHDDAMAEAGEASREAAALLAAAESALAEATEDTARLVARHQSVQRLIADTMAVLERAEGEAARAKGAVAAAEAAVVAAEDAFAAAEEAAQAAAGLAEACDEALEQAEAARATVQTHEGEARAARSQAEGEANALRAEVAALQRLVAREAGTRSALLDRLRVQPGYEAALGAALADDLQASEVAEGSGWRLLADYPAPQALPGGVQSLARFVQAPAVLTRRLSQIGLVDQAQAAAVQAALLPGQRLVSLVGDSWRWDGFVAGAEAAPSAAALRLQQINRLAALQRDLDEVGVRTEETVQAHEVVQARLADLARADQLARDARRAAEARLADAARAAARADADRSLAQGRLEAAGLAVARFRDEATEARDRLEEARAGAEDLDDPEDARVLVERAKLAVGGARLTMLTRRSALDERRRDGEARMRRRAEALREQAGWQARAQTAGRRNTELAERRGEAEAELQEAMAAPEDIAIKREELTEAMADAEERRRRAADALAEADAALRAAALAEREAERLAGEAREARARAEARVDAARDATVLAADRIAEETGATPAQLLATLKVDVDKMPGVDLLETDVARLKRQREALGAVNLRAEEDAKVVEVEYDTLAAEKLDLEEAIKKLRAGIASLNREGRERLLTAFEQVNANFATLFTHLFGGGEARLVLVESDDPLEAGLEIMCQPPGKKLAVLSLLSGGEQTLTALALIFGVFLANPAPICVLDEVDAPLDDANVTRFCDLLDEMTRRTNTRFLIITHHAVTMARMDRLFGVTMAEQGVSQLVSVDLTKAAALVA
jgi:chromosome segregation protein